MSHQNDGASSANIPELVRRDVRRQTARIYALEAARLLAESYDSYDAYRLLREAVRELDLVQTTYIENSLREDDERAQLAYLEHMDRLREAHGDDPALFPNWSELLGGRDDA